MAIVKPSTPPGVLELLPSDQVAFQRMLDEIRAGFERFGFLPIETPALERTDILLTKSGGETERQVYYVQSSGAWEQRQRIKMGLRFDLTVPLARYVAQHESALVFPFRRYQIQRVYRGESAQRGRFREFYQCDIDIVGKDSLSLACDAEMPAVIHDIFSKLDFGPFTIHINNRKLLLGLLDDLGIGDHGKRLRILREIDKLDKRTPEQVSRTLAGDLELDESTAGRIMAFVAVTGDNHDVLEHLRQMPIEAPRFRTGLEELSQVAADIERFGIPASNVRINVAIARGLDYYTGTVYETLLDDHPEVGSVCSGGRYDDLAGHFTRSRLPGVGISIGATRLFSQLQALGIVQGAHSRTRVLVTLFDPALFGDSLQLARRLRAAGINTEMTLEKRKLGKQLKYAERQGIRFAVILGPDERARGTVRVKDLETTRQAEVPVEDLVATVSGNGSQNENAPPDTSVVQPGGGHR